MSDSEIAHAAKLQRISAVAREKLGIGEEHLEPYGHYKAKVSLKYLDSLAPRKNAKLILVTGRELDDLLQVCADADIFDAVVVENGAVLYLPSSQRSITLASSPPAGFIEILRRRGVHPLSVGRSIVATVRSQLENTREAASASSGASGWASTATPTTGQPA